MRLRSTDFKHDFFYSVQPIERVEEVSTTPKRGRRSLAVTSSLIEIERKNWT
jgi:hypothetical protein